MIDTVANALKLMEGRRVLLVGDVMLDSYVYGETVRVSREAPVIVVRKESVEHRLGGAANTAANLASLGIRVEMLGVVGEDEGGGLLREMLEERGVDTHGLIAAEATTPVKTRVMAGAFGTTKQQVLRIDDEPSDSLSEEVEAQMVELFRERAAESEVIVLSDYGGGAIVPEIITLAAEMKAAGKMVCVDSRNRLHLFCGMTVVTPNVPEAEAQVGQSIISEEDVVRAGTALRERLNCEACLLTQGRGGMTLFREEAEPSHVRIIGEDEVTDVTGAGDTVIATFSAALAAGLGMENAMRLANCAAGVVVCKAGAAVASPAEIVAAACGVGLELVPWGV